MHFVKIITVLLGLAAVVSCGGSGPETQPDNTQGDSSGIPKTNSPDDTNTDAPQINEQKIKLNQVGYLPTGDKVAIVPNITAQAFDLVAVDNGVVVFQGDLSAAGNWSAAGDDLHKQANFTAFEQAGEYYIRVQGLNDSSTFTIASNVYGQVHDSALKSYYYNRASIDIAQPYAGDWPRLAGHSDNSVIVHSSAASPQTPTGSTLNSAKGWYDAGDYGKYSVNSGIATYTLLAAFEHFPDFYQQRVLNIPESSDQVPDILNEIMWNLTWLASMQDQDGGVYHKLTTLNWPGIEMPAQDTRDRYVIGKTTAASLNFAAVFATASRIFSQYPQQFPGKSAQWQLAAESAWQWAQQHPSSYYQQPSDVTSGQYGDNSVADELSWAAAELFISTGKDEYYQAYLSYDGDLTHPSWQNVSYLAISSLLFKGESMLSSADYQSVKSKQQAFADGFLVEHNQSEYLVAMPAGDFIWGSNAVAMNKAMVLLQAYQQSQDDNYRQAALGLVDYVLGKNPTDYSFVTGFGAQPPMYPHHRISAGDNITAPIPGMLVGGPNAGRQDGCSYPDTAPALSYVDDWCSYASNEVAINWNAPLVYVLAALLSE